MQRLGAENSVLAIPGFKIAIVPKTGDADVGRQGLTQVRAVASKAKVKNGHFDSLAAIAGGSPAIDPEKSQVTGTLLQNIRINRGRGGIR
jgi:hypothetical protein